MNVSARRPVKPRAQQHRDCSRQRINNQEALMNRPFSSDQALSDARLVSQSSRARERHDLAVWALAIGAVLIVISAVAMESSLPADQRFELLRQTSVYP
jgi:hypothetical protein